MHHANVNVNLMVEYLTQIKSRAMINADVRTKIQENMCEEKITFRILLHVIVKMASNW